MIDRQENYRLLNSVRNDISYAENEIDTLKRLFSVYQSRMNDLNTYRRKMLFSPNEIGVASEFISLVNELEIVNNNLNASRVRIAMLLTAALSVIVNQIEYSEKLSPLLMPRIRNILRNITGIVQETKEFNVDYSSIASLAIRGSFLMTFKENITTASPTKRLFDVLLKVIV